MAIHPHVTERLRAEIIELCGPEAPPTLSRVKDLKYSKLPHLRVSCFRSLINHRSAGCHKRNPTPLPSCAFQLPRVSRGGMPSPTLRCYVPRSG